MLVRFENIKPEQSKAQKALMSNVARKIEVRWWHLCKQVFNIMFGSGFEI